VLVSSHVLAEVAQTVDQVLIINRGRLVTESPLTQLTARAGGSVRIRTPEPDRLRAALEQEQIQTSSTNEHALLAHGTSSDRVGQIAFAAGVPLYELVAESSSLEDVFLQLTTQEQP
jgi:ABC-2 type transport system ATP-binding protein